MSVSPAACASGIVEGSDHGVLEGSHSPGTGFFHEHPQAEFLV
jgi:hypothetical protein